MKKIMNSQCKPASDEQLGLNKSKEKLTPGVIVSNGKVCE